MALHGTIEVNGHLLGRWAAVRGNKSLGMPWADPDVDPGPAYYYHCEVSFYRDDKTLRFVIEHWFKDGAVALAAKILEQARYENLGELPE
jgi:hypothetical protein